LVAHILTATVGERGSELIKSVVDTIRGHVGDEYRWPGNVRELEQAVRRVLLTGSYQPERSTGNDAGRPPWLADAELGKLDADGVLAGYCRQLHAELGSYEAVAGRTRLDRRTVRKYVHMAGVPFDNGSP
jgi:DNA-binding NtrC family response regulator